MKKVSVLFYDTHAVHLFNDPMFPSGGAAKQVMAWSKGLNDLGVKTYIMGAHDDPLVFKKYNNIIISYKLNMGIRLIRYVYIRIPRIILGLHKSKANYIYYGIPGREAILLALISIILRKKFILRIASDNFVSIKMKRKNILQSYVYKFSFRLSHYIFCQNTHQYDKLVQNYPKKTFKLSNPYIGTITNNILPLNKRKHVSWIGRVSYAKNIPLLLEIAKSLPDVTFKIAGDMGKHRDTETAEIINTLREIPNVSILGQLNAEDILKLLSESYIFLNTSHFEGFPNTYLEAFSVGTPVFAMEKADPDSIIKNNKLGYVYRDIDDLLCTFRKLLIDKDGYDVMASNCVRYMKTRHNLNDQSREFLNIILNE